MNRWEFQPQVYLPAVYLRFATQAILRVWLFRIRNLRVISKTF